VTVLRSRVLLTLVLAVVVVFVTLVLAVVSRSSALSSSFALLSSSRFSSCSSSPSAWLQVCHHSRLVLDIAVNVVARIALVFTLARTSIQQSTKDSELVATIPER
jgi:hypothetical protein